MLPRDTELLRNISRKISRPTKKTLRKYIKNKISGHGADDNDCSEFCSKYYNVKINGTAVSQKQLWKS